MDREKMIPRAGEDESVLDETEDALVGDHPDTDDAPVVDKREREDPDEPRPFLKSP